MKRSGDDIAYKPGNKKEKEMNANDHLDFPENAEKPMAISLDINKKNQ